MKSLNLASCTIAQIKKANKELGHVFFSLKNKKFFNSEIESAKPYPGGFFITSERMEEEDPKRYTVRKAEFNGAVTTIGSFTGFKTLAGARNFANSKSKEWLFIQVVNNEY